MALNPIAYTEKVVRSFLRYQLTAYPFADPRLHAQMRELLSLDRTRRSPLLKGPYVSLSRPFRQGAPIDDLIAGNLLHPHLRERIPKGITHFYGHRERAIRAIAAGRTTLVSTGTGSGKTECFLYPIVSRCLQLRDEAAPPGISAVIVYPMNALAEDQLMRLRALLAGTGIPFGIYVGKTPENEAGVAGVRLPAGSSRADYETRLERARRAGSGETVYPGADGWPEALYAALSRNELVFRLNEELETPRALDELPPALERHVGRPVTKAEILIWLTLGTAARHEGRPLLRPVVHGFVRGIGGAVVSFPEGTVGPRLWLAAEDEAGPAESLDGEHEKESSTSAVAPSVPGPAGEHEREPPASQEPGEGQERKPAPGEGHARFPITTCTTCGQHYYVAFLKDFTFTGKRPGGGDTGSAGSWWEPLDETLGGRRVVLVDRLIGASDDEDDEAEAHSAAGRRVATAAAGKDGTEAARSGDGSLRTRAAPRESSTSPSVAAPPPHAHIAQPLRTVRPERTRASRPLRHSRASGNPCALGARASRPLLEGAAAIRRSARSPANGAYRPRTSSLSWRACSISWSNARCSCRCG